METSPRRLFASGLAAAVIAGAAVALSPATAYACSCAGATTAQHFDHADVVAAGRLTQVSDPHEVAQGLQESGRMVEYTIEVSELVKGEAPGTVQVFSTADGAACGLEGMSVGQDYLLYGRGAPAAEPGVLFANLCDGTGPLSATALAEVQELAADQGIEPILVPTSSHLATGAGEGESSILPPVPVVLAGGLALLGALTWWLARRRRA